MTADPPRHPSAAPAPAAAAGVGARPAFPDRILEARDISWSVTEPSGLRRPVLKEVGLQLAPGAVVGLTGPSGSGKTSLLRVLSGLLVPDSGCVRLGGEPVRDVRTRAGSACAGRIGVVFQAPRAAMDPRRTLQDSIALAAAQARRRRRRSSGKAQASRPDLRVLARQVGLTEDVLGRRPAQVSDGQLQRAAVLRTLAHDPDVILCDEVTAALDPIAAAAVMRLLQRIAQEHARAVLLLSHDHRLLAAITEHVLSMDDVTRA